MTDREIRFWPTAKDAVTFIGSIAAAIAGAVGVVYLLVPAFEPREQLGAVITNIAVTHDVGYYSYKGETDEEEIPQGNGIEVLVAANLQAFSTRSYRMETELLDAKNLTRIMPTDDHEPFFAACSDRSPKVDEELVVWRCWILAPKAGSEYIVRAKLYDSGPTREIKEGMIEGPLDPLAFRDSEVFRVPKD